MQNETKTHWLTKSYGNGAFLLMRVWLGIAMLIHGYKSVIGGEMAGFVEYIDSFGIPAPQIMGWLAKGSEFLGGIFLILGLFSKISALFIFITMLVATLVIHIRCFNWKSWGINLVLLINITCNNDSRCWKD